MVGEEGDHISLYTDQNDSCIGSDDSHFNVSLTVKDTVTRVCENKKTKTKKGFEEIIKAYRYTVTTSMTPALRRAAMTALLMFS